MNKNCLNFNRLLNARGIGLLELMLSLAIIAILLIMATRYYEAASSNNSVSSAVDMANAVKSAIKSYMNANMNTSTIQSIATLESEGYLPAAYANPSTANPWGGVICAGAGATACTADASFTVGTSYNVSMTGLPGPICVQVEDRINSTLNEGEAATCSATTGTDVTFSVNYLM